MTRLRPWGPLEWVLSKFVGTSWDVIGTVSVEERCLAVPRMLTIGRVARSTLFAIFDPEPLDTEAFIERIELRKGQFRTSGFGDESFRDTTLFVNLDEIEDHLEGALGAGNRSVVLDVSTMPKRWFFPFMKMLLAHKRVENIVVSYASPSVYGDQLAENPGPILVLPGFAGSGTQNFNSIVIGIGFEPLGLTNLVKELEVKRIRLLFPFPPGPPGYQKNWMFVKAIEEMTSSQDLGPPDRQSIHMFDCPHIFDALCEMTQSGESSSVLAPYGPKPMSLAMCLFSLAVADADKELSPVYYAQPKRYSLDYSSGIRLGPDGLPDIKGYLVKLGGRPLYRV